MQIGYYSVVLAAGIIVGGAIGYFSGMHKCLEAGFKNLSAHFRMRGR